MDHNGFNVKLVDDLGRDGGRWRVQPDNTSLIVYINRELKAYRAEEPTANWHLQTCGTHIGYHRVHGTLPVEKSI